VPVITLPGLSPLRSTPPCAPQNTGRPIWQGASRKSRQAALRSTIPCPWSRARASSTKDDHNPAKALSFCVIALAAHAEHVRLWLALFEILSMECLAPEFADLAQRYHDRP
jgi:hypothetical protein